MTTTLILGGARSGKSAYAEKLARESGKKVVVIATATAGDVEMAARIERHRADRPIAWQTIEEPINLAAAISRAVAPERVVLVDCLTLWLANTLFTTDHVLPEADVSIAMPSELFVTQRSALLDVLTTAAGDIILVSNEVGLGIIPLGAGNRLFVDEAGRLNQAVAAVCDKVVFVAAGLPLVLKGDN